MRDARFEPGDLVIALLGSGSVASASISFSSSPIGSSNSSRSGIAARIRRIKA